MDKFIRVKIVLEVTGIEEGNAIDMTGFTPVNILEKLKAMDGYDETWKITKEGFTKINKPFRIYKET